MEGVLDALHDGSRYTSRPPTLEATTDASDGTVEVLTVMRAASATTTGPTLLSPPDDLSEE